MGFVLGPLLTGCGINHGTALGEKNTSSSLHRPHFSSSLDVAMCRSVGAGKV